jgi:hypothetical protein
MKTTIEVQGFEIKIEEMEGKITVSAMKEGETVEEFELESEDFESQDMPEGDEDDDMDAFGEEEDMEEEDDFEEESEEMEEESEEMEEEGKLESFSYFVKKRKK